MLIRTMSGEIISSVEEWKKLSPPASKDIHWVDGRSAKELAKAWLRNGKAEVPFEINTILESHPLTRGLKVEYAIPEYETKLDGYGKGRKHDLFVLAKNNGENVVISIEAKADEPFGLTIRERLNSKNPKGSNIEKRIIELKEALFAKNDVGELRYQLLYGIGGTLIEAKNRNAKLAVFIVHEFLSSKTSPKKTRKNCSDLNQFVSSLVNTSIELNYGTLFGPIFVSGGSNISKEIPLLIGKVKTNLTL
ncbi:hypothetical protein H839_08559 [Parageobacillus genomosp. 1]|uniref:DUF6946 domain-containing protein n=1 Tax=Parageobacillus genomosp. 1 TaxID=1295642 RepID=A0ABC9VGF6_9BACL|nr:hypothetical protein [Parageobacillus genomosp. 1]EZP77671.1 hypothetical protein H839_08559 [Parageobacillus genomosp. 1]